MLPASLREDYARISSVPPAHLEAAMRPGCTHLSASCLHQACPALNAFVADGEKGLNLIKSQDVHQDSLVAHASCRGSSALSGRQVRVYLDVFVTLVFRLRGFAD